MKRPTVAEQIKQTAPARPVRPRGLTNRQLFLATLLAACLSGVACVATLIEPQWFELLFDEAPDGGDGSLETIVAVAVSLVSCLVFAWLARREWRRSRRDPTAMAEVRTRP